MCHSSQAPCPYRVQWNGELHAGANDLDREGSPRFEAKMLGIEIIMNTVSHEEDNIVIMTGDQIETKIPQIRFSSF